MDHVLALKDLATRLENDNFGHIANMLIDTVYMYKPRLVDLIVRWAHETSLGNDNNERLENIRISIMDMSYDELMCWRNSFDGPMPVDLYELYTNEHVRRVKLEGPTNSMTPRVNV